MGCGGSRLDRPTTEVLPAKIRPLLWRRYEEIKRQTKRSLSKDTTHLSKKQLLKDGNSEGDVSFPSDDDRRSISSDEDDVKVAPAPATLMEPQANKQYERVKDKSEEAMSPAGSVDLVNSNQTSTQIMEVKTGSQDLASPTADDDKERSNKQDGEHDEDGRDKTSEEMARVMKNANEKEIDRDDDEDEDEQDGELEDEEEGRLVCSSPSFRVYFIEALPNTDDEDKDDDTDKKSSSDHDHSERTTESGNFDELPGCVEKKKGGKGGRFGRVIPKGKNLLKVKSCYHPSCSRHNKQEPLIH